MAPCFAIRMTETGRQFLSITLLFVNTLIVGTGGIGLLTCQYVLRSRAGTIRHAAAYGTEALDWLLACTSGVFAIVHSVGARFSWDTFVYYNRHRVADFLELWLLCVISVLGLNALGAILANAQRDHLQRVLEAELKVTLFEYGTRLDSKTAVDKMQMKLGCCGDTGVTDWIKIVWKLQIPFDADDKYRESDPLVPFSCCNPAFLGPCIVSRGPEETASVGFSGAMKESLHKVGCRKALNENIGEILTIVIILHLVTFFLQITVIIGTRYLQTSIETSYLNNNPFLPSVAWLLEEFGNSNSPTSSWAEEACDRLHAQRIAAAWMAAGSTVHQRNTPNQLPHDSSSQPAIGENKGRAPSHYYLRDDDLSVDNGKIMDSRGKSREDVIKEREHSQNPVTNIREMEFCINVIPTKVKECCDDGRRSPAGASKYDLVSSNQRPKYNEHKKKKKRKSYQTKSDAASTHRHECRNKYYAKYRNINDTTKHHHHHHHKHRERLNAGGTTYSPLELARDIKTEINKLRTQGQQSQALSLEAVKYLSEKNIRIIHEVNGLLTTGLDPTKTTATSDQTSS